jgi:RNA-binding protein
MPEKLTGKAARELRGEGHHLRPAVMIGKEGLSDKVKASLLAAFEGRRLIKVKILDTEGMDRKAFAESIADAVGAQVAQVLGKTVLLFREPPPKKAEADSEASE